MHRPIRSADRDTCPSPSSSAIAVPLNQRKSYHSYLIRCWVSGQPAPSNGARARFVVESIAARPQRWGFETFEDLVAFLHTKLLEDEPQQSDDAPNDSG